MIRIVLGIVFVLALTLLGVRGDTKIATVDQIEQTQSQDDDVATNGSFGSQSEEEDDDDAPPLSIEGREIPRHVLHHEPVREHRTGLEDIVMALRPAPEPPPPRA